MTDIKDGGPAFPHENRHQANWEGMSLRDYFAGQALTGLARSHAEGTVDDYQPEHVAQDCYRLADAMLKERERSS